MSRDVCTADCMHDNGCVGYVKCDRCGLTDADCEMRRIDGKRICPSCWEKMEEANEESEEEYD